jgi:hypothetical protein
MKIFHSMPSYKDWQKKSSVIFAFRSTDRVLKQIDDLVKLYWRMPDGQAEIAYQIYRATTYWMKYVGVKFKGTERRMDSIEGLHAYIKKSFAQAYNLDLDEIDDLLLMIFGKPVHVAYEDTEVFNESRTVLYVKDEQERRKYKLAFRKGLAYKRDQEGNLVLYDTQHETGKDADGESIFVMDRHGRIYTGSYNRGEFHHSSFLSGFWSTSAGVMKVTRGQIVTVCPDSGHYQPGPQQMLNIVERLKTLGVELHKLTVRLFDIEKDGKFKGQPKQKYGKYVWDERRGDQFLATRGA